MAQKRKHYDKQFKMPASQVVLGVKMRAVDLARELETKNSTLRPWAQECKEMGEDAIRNAEAHQLCVGDATTATAPCAPSIRHLGKAAAGHMPITREIDKIVAKVTVGGFLINVLSSIPNRRFHNTSGFSHPLRIAALMASLAAFGKTFEATRFA